MVAESNDEQLHRYSWLSPQTKKASLSEAFEPIALKQVITHQPQPTERHAWLNHTAWLE